MWIHSRKNRSSSFYPLHGMQRILVRDECCEEVDGGGEEDRGDWSL